MKINVKFTSEDMDEFTVLEVDSFEEAKDLISSPYYMHWDRAFILNADTDEVIKENDSLTVASNPKWKKVLFGVLAAAGLVFGGYKFRTKLIPFVKNGWNRLNPVQGLKNGWNKFVNFITKPFRKAPPTPAP